VWQRVGAFPVTLTFEIFSNRQTRQPFLLLDSKSDDIQLPRNMTLPDLDVTLEI